jgi:hypothetical protein
MKEAIGEVDRKVGIVACSVHSTASAKLCVAAQIPAECLTNQTATVSIHVYKVNGIILRRIFN